MQEYKREKNTLETRLKELSKRAAYHDDHIRMIDAWFSQVCGPLLNYPALSLQEADYRII